MLSARWPTFVAVAYESLLMDHGQQSQQHSPTWVNGRLRALPSRKEFASPRVKETILLIYFTTRPCLTHNLEAQTRLVYEQYSGALLIKVPGILKMISLPPSR